jgi:hypothetical protein
MTSSNDDNAPRPQAVVAGDLDGAGTLNARAGASLFSIGGPDGNNSISSGKTTGATLDTRSSQGHIRPRATRRKCYSKTNWTP